MKDLRYLYLTSTSVTDADLAPLAALTALRYLDLRKTTVTDAGVARLQRALPELSINH